MSLCRIHMKRLAYQAGQCYLGRQSGVSSQCITGANLQPWNAAACVRHGPLVTGVRLCGTADAEPNKQPIKKKKEKPNARKVIANVGHLIPYKFIQVIDVNGEDLGRMNKSEVLKMMEERDLKLVSHRESKDPPVYRLLTGKQLFKEQSELREKQKLSSGPGIVQTKEVSIVSNISQSDLELKKKQLSQWIEKKHRVKVTILNSRSAAGLVKEDVLQRLLKSVEDHATYLSDPIERKDGRALLCIIRPMSEGELQKRKKDQKQGNRQEPVTAQNTNVEHNPDMEPTSPTFNS